MIVECQACNTIFPVDPLKVPAGGIHARCSVCNEVFFVSVPEPEVDLVPTAVLGASAEVPAEEVETTVEEVEETFEAEEEVTVEEVEETFEAEEEVTVDEVDEVEGTFESEETAFEEAKPDFHAESPGFEKDPGAPSGVTTRDFEEGEVSFEQDEPEAVEVEPEAVEEAETTFGEAEPTFGDAETIYGAAEPTFGEAETTFGEAEPTFGEAETTFGEAEPTFGEAETTFGEADPSLDEVESVVEETEITVEEATSQVVDAVEEEPETPFVAAPLFGKRDPMEKAQRLARVLVSDIILYNPDRHHTATESGQVKEEFEEEIQKSWNEYVEQVGEEVANSTGFFNDALNEILAKGEQIF